METFFSTVKLLNISITVADTINHVPITHFVYTTIIISISITVNSRSKW